MILKIVLLKLHILSYESKKIDHITSISILLLENNTEATMEIKTFDKTKADNLVSTFVNFYRPYCSKVDKYDNNLRICRWILYYMFWC